MVLRILMTGSSGFIGQSLIRDLSASGHSVCCLGRSAPALPNVTLVETNISDPTSMRASISHLKSLPKFDSLIHLAVSRHHREFPQKALDLFYVNSASVAELLDFARETGVKQAIFGSTGTVYSSTSDSDGQNALGNHESEFRKPMHYFAASKLFADSLCEFYRSYLPIATLRLYAPYGPGLTDRMITDLVSRVETGKLLSLPATGPGLSFSSIYIDDALAVIHRALSESWNETVNVASAHVLTIESAGKLIGEIIGREPKYERGTQVSVPRILPDTRRLAALMPEHAFIEPEAGIRKMIASIR
jgi:UDP-glucose 4-epimerase